MNRKSRIQAAIDGANEIGFAILAMTFTLVVVFMPLLFMTGELVNSLLVCPHCCCGGFSSGFIALTLTPMMCSKLLKNKKSSSINSSPVLKNKELFSDRLNNFYSSVLRKAIEAKVLIVGFLYLLLL